MRIPRIPDKTYSILVMSDGGASLKKFKITGRKIRWIVGGAGGLVFLVLAAAIVAAVFGASWSADSERLGALARENQELRDRVAEANSEVHQVQSKVASIAGALHRLTEYARRLRRFTHLSDPERNLAMGPVASKGEDDEDAPSAVDAVGENEQMGPLSRERRKMRVGLVRRKLDRLEGEAAQTQRGLEALERYFRDRQVILTSTPSIWPSRGIFASGFGMRRDPIIGVYSFHKGIDIFAESGTPVIAPAAGVVIFAGNQGGYGLQVVLDHGFGLKTRFAHLSVVEAKVGQKVKRGDRIGLVGSTGRSTGPHLHYEVHLNGVPQNPFRYILD